MLRVNVFLLVISLFAGVNVQSQDHITLTGVVRDSETKEVLAGASVRIPGTAFGTQSDQSGQFRLI